MVRPARLLPALQSSVTKKLEGRRTGRILQERLRILTLMYRTGIKIIFFPLLYIRSSATRGFSRRWPESLMSHAYVVFQGFCEFYEVTSPLWVHTFTLRHSLLSAAKVPYVHTHFMSLSSRCPVLCCILCVCVWLLCYNDAYCFGKLGNRNENGDAAT